MPDTPRRVRFAPDTVLQVIDGDALILKLQQEAVFSLNETGARIAELIAEGKTIDEIVETLAAEYDRSRDDLERDVRDLVTALLSRGLLVAAGEHDA